MKRVLFLSIFLALAAGIYVFWVQGPGQEQASESPVTAPTPETVDHKHKPKPEKAKQLGGFVVDSQSEGVLDVKVELFRVAKPGDLTPRGAGKIPARGWKLAESISNFAGRFYFSMPSVGKYFLRASKEGFATQEIPTFEIEGDSFSQEFRISLIRESRIRVIIHNQARSITGAAVLRAKGLEPRIQPLDSDGSTIFQGLAPGDYLVQFDPGSENSTHYFWEETPADVSNVHVAEGEEKIFSFALEGEKPGSISGTVLMNGVAPQESVFLSLQLQNKPLALQFYPVKELIAKTDSNGHYRIEKVLPGEYRALVKMSLLSTALAEKTVRIGETENATADFYLRTGQCKGRVLNAKGEPITQARVVMQGGSQQQPLIGAYWTDLQGRFFSDTFPTGNYQLTIYPGTQENWSKQIEIGEGELDLGEIQIP